MKRLFPGLAVALLVVTGIALTACGDDDDETGTGVPAVDAAIAALLANDGAALAEQAVFTTIGCTQADGLGGPPKCAAGQAEGTQLTVMPAASCEGYYLREEEIGGSAEAFAAAESVVHGVYRSGGIGDFFSADYIILIEADDPQFGGKMAREVYLTDEGVTGLFFGCGHSVEDLIESHQLSDELAYTPGS